ncbi:hypothetical protein [Streptomyces sp. NPDC006610]|uniref:hypothetical protein n=1 Tax=Streptomyces sp. NPDC006610 TaxID=3154584 RepID=UPI0033B545A8
MRAVAVGAVMCSASAAPPAAADEAPGAYGFAEDARTVEAGAGTADAAPLEPGTPYRSSLPAGGAAYYRLDLGADSSAYVSATAVPAPDAAVAAVEGIKVTVRDAEGGLCDSGSTTFGSGRSPHPIAAWAAREAGTRRCRAPGVHYVVVERVGANAPAPDAWDLELAVTEEPPLASARAGSTPPPDDWDSATPRPPTDSPRRRPGGTGFSSAARIGDGVWTADLRPGQTLFYEVPVDWGRQLYATAELGGGGEGSGYVVGALELAVYNPVRGYVEDVSVGYGGRPRSAAPAPLPPVAHDNRRSFTGRVSGTRFAGSYYLAVHLAGQVAGTFGQGPFAVTLRVRVTGEAEAGPEYAGESVPEGVFEAAEDGGPFGTAGSGDDGGTAVRGAAGGDDGVMRMLAVGGIGGGTVILAGLGVWTAVARRKGAVPR